MSPPGRLAAAAAGLLVLDALVRLLAGDPYPGATALLVAACGVSLVPFLPRELGTSSLRVAVVPALGLGSFALLLTTVSIVGVELTELSIRLAVVGLVLAAGVFTLRSKPAARALRASSRRELAALAALIGVFALSFASSYDIVEPFPPPGTDWAHNLQYAEQIEAQGGLLIDDPFRGNATPVFANPPGIGAVYGGLLILDGVSSPSLARGIAVFSALGSLGVYAAVGGLWGMTAGLLAAATYAVAPIRLETMYWHGLGTTLALVFVPLAVLAVAPMCRGSRNRGAVALLGFSLAAVAVVHPPSAVVLAAMIGIVLAADVVLGVLRFRQEGRRAWRRRSVARPILASLVLAAAVGAGAIVHVGRQAVELGSLVGHRAFDREWLDLDTVEYYFSWPFLVLVGASLVIVAWGRERRRDPALAAFGALALAAVLVSQGWRVELAFEYRRVVYYMGPVLVALIGLASYRLVQRRAWIAVCAVAFVVVARDSIGVRLPERLMRGGEPRSESMDVLAAFRDQLARDDPSSRMLLVADRCLGVRVPYVVRRPTLVSAEDWQVGYESLVRDARDATTVVEGGPDGRRLAAELGVDYVLVDPECHPDAAARLDGKLVYASDELVAIDVRGA